ncbi:MAG TPA: tetratricopeptide repeat protein [Verrucomicrobiae bacterium]
MTRPLDAKDRESRRARPWLPDGIFCLICGLLVGMFTWFSDTSAPLESVFSKVNEAPYNLLAQSFSAGQLNLKENVPPGFAKLANPYDPNLNAPYMGGALDDLTYYKGKLYLYFGLTPALVLFWPYYALTGHYLSEKEAVAFFMGVGFAVIAGLLRAVRRRYFPETGSWIPAAGTMMPGLALALTLPVNVHEIAITCAFAFVMLALAAVWMAMHAPGRRAWWLALASLAYGLAIGARPNLLFGAVILLLPVLQACGQSGGNRTRRIAGLFLAAAGPIAFVGLGLMFYNFLRFNNPLEFGWRYQLNTSYQASSAHPFGLNNFWFNFRLYFLEPINWTRQFPYLKSAPLPPNPQGYDLGNAYAGGGILIIYPIVFFIIAAPLAWKRHLERTESALGWFATACLLLFLAGALTLCLFFASASSYELDFLPGLLLLAFLGAYCADQAALRFPGRRRLICFGCFLLMTYSIAINLLANIEARAENDFFLGNFFLSAGQPDQAKAQYEKTLALSPECADAYGGLGNILSNQGRLDEAMIDYQKALEINPDFVEVQNNIGYCFLQKGRLDDAIAHYEKAVELRPLSVKYRNSLGNAYSKKGLWDAAIAQFEKSVEIEPALADAHNDLGDCFLHVMRIDEAIVQYQTAVQLKPESAPFHAALGNALIEKGQFDDAMAQYQTALVIQSDSADIHERFGDALFRKGELDKAIIQYQAAVKLQPGLTQAHNNLGYCLQQTGHPDEAVAQYLKAIELQPGFAPAYNNLGNAYRQKKMAAQAIAGYQKAVDLAPQFVAPQLNLAWMLATWPDANVRNGAKALVIAEHLNDLAQGKDPKILRTLAAAYAETGQFAEASSSARKALALASARSDTALTNALQTELNLYLAHAPRRSTDNF